MKISYNWLKEILEFNLDSDQTSALLTDIGLEVEREELYEKVSDHVVMTENKSSQDVASEIISLVKS